MQAARHGSALFLRRAATSVGVMKGLTAGAAKAGFRTLAPGVTEGDDGVLRVDSGRATHTCILSHGLGDTGFGWLSAAHELHAKLPHIRFVLPTAPSIPVTLNGGFVM